MRMFKFLPVLVFLLSPFYSHASHMMGAEITYKWLGNKKYEITAKVYRDCRGIPFNSPTMNVSDYNGKSIAMNYSRISIEDITPRCPDSTSGPCNPQNTTQTREGVELHTYKATVDFGDTVYSYFPNNGICKVYFTLEQCCRNGAITTLNPGNFYIDAMLDLCNSKYQNSSPQFKGRNVLFANCNIPFSQNLGAKDFEDYDSLTFELVNPLNAANSNEQYTGNFTPTIPMTPFCTTSGVINCSPQPTAKPPRGFYFNKQNADMVFLPTSCSEVGVISVKITEYRYNAGTNKWVVVGFVKRDLQIIVKSLSIYNNLPTMNLASAYNFTTRKKTCYDITTYDTMATGGSTGNKGDRTTLNVVELPAGATFTYVDSTARLKTGRLCWQPHDSVYLKLKTKSKLIPMAMELKDNYCYTPAVVQKGFNIKLMAPDSSGYLGINTFRDKNKNGIKNTGEKGVSVKLKFKDAYSAYYINTDTAGLLGDSMGIGNVKIGVASHPYYQSTTPDTLLKIKMDSAHALAFGVVQNPGIYGRIYEDANGNCKFDKGELPYSGYKVFTDSNKYVGISDKNGIYFISAPAGTYNLACDFKPLQFSVNCPVAKTITLTTIADSAYTGNDFGVSKNKDFKDLSVGINVGRLRRGYASGLSISCTNTGFVTRKNIQLKVPVNSKFDLVHGSTTYSAGTTASISIDSLVPNQTFKYDFTFTISASKFNSKDEVCYTVSTDSTSTSEDSIKSNNTAKACRIVDAPYDPNNKLISADTAKTTLDRIINYTVQFQNTGTDTAIRVVVIDTVDTKHLTLDRFNLDWSDYPCETIIQGNIIHFIFDNINLPTLALSGDKSIGAFNFTLGLKEGLAAETAVKNKVAIFFDFEKPVITQTAIATINSPIIINRVKSKVFCVNDANRISFTSKVPLNAGNTMIVELSDAGGAFSQPVVLNSKATTSLTDSINFTLPESWNGGNYKLRIRSTNPAAVSIPSKGYADITATDKPSYLLNSNLSNNSICDKDTLRISLNNTTYLYKVLENNVPVNSNFSNTKNYNLQVNTNDSFRVIAIDNASGCKDTTDIKPTVLPKPTITAEILNRKQVYCEGDNITLKGNGGSFYVYTKNNTILANKTTSNTFATKLDANAYYRITGEGANGCSNNSDTLMVSVNPAPAAQLSIAPNPLCGVDTATFTMSNDFNKDLYKNNQLLLDNTSLLTYKITGLVNGDQFYLSSTTNKGCTKTSPVITIAVYPLPAKPVITASGTNLNVNVSTGTIAWYRNGNLLSNTGTSISNAPSGTYKVVVTSNDGCTSASDDFAHVNVGVKTISVNDIKVYPNPADAGINISFMSSDYTAQLFDMNGALVYTANHKSGEARIDTHEMNSGIYLLKLTDAQGRTAYVKIGIMH